MNFPTNREGGFLEKNLRFGFAETTAKWTGTRVKREKNTAKLNEGK